uniref:Uncharacterized protein n=1 Tax=Strigamia maritima TaxID=126957 RepID=T1IN63_STRMM
MTWTKRSLHMCGSPPTVFRHPTSASNRSSSRNAPMTSDNPEVVYSDNGTHFGPLLTSVKIVKRSLKKADDGYRALQLYRSTPLANGFSPAKLLNGRAIRTSVPVISTKLNPKTPDRETIFKKEDIRRNAQKSDYDRRYRARDLALLNVGDTVWIVDLQRQGSVVSLDSAPRSYIITSNGRSIRRNRFHLQLLPSSQPDGEDGEEDVDNTPVGNETMITNEPERSTTIDEADPDVRDGTEKQEYTTDAETAPLPPVPAPTYVTRSGRTVKPRIIHDA